MLPTVLSLPSGLFTLRRADAGDLDHLIGLLADDAISSSRGDIAAPEDRPAYERAFAAIDSDAAHHLIVGTTDIELLATMQLTVIPGLPRVGASRLQIEAVRVRSDARNRGLGAAMIRWAVEQAPALGCTLVQLTSDAARLDAHRFYERLGFTASHVGFKLSVPPAR